MGKAFSQVRTPNELLEFLREFVNLAGEPTQYDATFALLMLTSLVESLSEHCITEDVKGFAETTRLTDKQVAFLTAFTRTVGGLK